jgi:predicted HicB family RNase H-like nuclease
MKTMIYKGYAARIEYSEEDRCLIGHIAGIKDMVGFHSHSSDPCRTLYPPDVRLLLFAKPV